MGYRPHNSNMIQQKVQDITMTILMEHDASIINDTIYFLKKNYTGRVYKRFFINEIHNIVRFSSVGIKEEYFASSYIVNAVVRCTVTEFEPGTRFLASFDEWVENAGVYIFKTDVFVALIEGPQTDKKQGHVVISHASFSPDSIKLYCIQESFP